MTDFDYLATCPVGVGNLLADELERLGAIEVRESPSGVEAKGPLSLAYRACLWSRLANRFLVRITDTQVDSTEAVYQAAKAVNWPNHFAPKAGFAVEFRGQTSYIKNTHFGALKVKDAIVDRFREAGFLRPSVAKNKPDIRVVAQLSKGRLSLSIDLSGDSLHRRGYRLDGGKAPLKENIAAAILYRAGWRDVSARGGSLIDPMCGSGTLLLEAAMIALDRAPALDRNRFGFQGWSYHNEPQWNAVLADAKARAQSALPEGVEIRGYDGDLAAIRRAEENAERLGFSRFVRVKRRALADIVKPSHKPLSQGLIVTNPPWGERLGTADSVKQLYRALGEKLHHSFQGWTAAIVASDPVHARATGLRSHKQYALKSGPLDIAVYLFSMSEDNRLSDVSKVDASTSEVSDAVLSPGAQMIVNRLKKNQRRMSKWLREDGITCYRLYDADMPEYAAAIDVYGSEVHIAEYAAPKSVDPADSERRFEELVTAVSTYFAKSKDELAIKQRRRQRGQDQYQRMGETREKLVVQELGAKLLVNLHDYIDTGLFLDHRPLRQTVQASIKDKRFLNLFSYTGVASIQAVVGGARFSTSVDLSNTYLNWYRENLALNGFSEAQHRAIRSDVFAWLEANEQRYDVILLDPPTFSNSKSTEQDFDVQADHRRLIELTMGALDQGGILYFSNNNRRFVFDQALEQAFAIEEITASTIPPDFQRSPMIHRCWQIRHKDANPQAA